jgi:hypothetical protein
MKDLAPFAIALFFGGMTWLLASNVGAALAAAFVAATVTVALMRLEERVKALENKNSK